MDVIHCHLTQLEDLFLISKSPSLNEKTRAALLNQCCTILQEVGLSCLELELQVRERLIENQQPVKITSRVESKLEVSSSDTRPIVKKIKPEPVGKVIELSKPVPRS